MSGYLRMGKGKNTGRRMAEVVPFPEGGKDGKSLADVEKSKPAESKPKSVVRTQNISQYEKDKVRVKSLIEVGANADIDWSLVASLIVDQDLIFDQDLVDKFLTTCPDKGIKESLVDEFSLALHREFSRRKGQYVGWHHNNVHRLLKLVSWILRDDICYVNEVEELRALYDSHQTLFPESLELRVKAKLESIGKNIARVTPIEEPAKPRRKKCRPKPRPSEKEQAKLKAERKEKAAARRLEKRKSKNGGGKKDKGKGKNSK